MKCVNCSWSGDIASDTLHGVKCPVCGDEVTGEKSVKPEPEPKKEEKINFDVNGDGKVDKSDYTEMAKKLGGRGGRKSKGKRK